MVANMSETRVESVLGGFEWSGVMLTVPCGEDTTVVDRVETVRRHKRDDGDPDTIAVTIARQDTDPDHRATYRSASIRLDKPTALRLAGILHDIASEADDERNA